MSCRRPRSDQANRTTNYYYGNGTGYGRYYDPAIGRFTQPDPIVQLAIGSGQTIESLGESAKAYREGKWGELACPNPQMLNRYSYVAGNPSTHVDPNGHVIWFAVAIGAVVGAAVGGLGYVAGSVLTQHEMTWSEAGVAVGVGAVAGALAPVVATTGAGAIALGAASNLMQYSLTQAVNQQQWEPGVAGLSVVTGAVGGKIGGTISDKTLGRMAQYSLSSRSDVERVLRSAYNWDYAMEQMESLPRAISGAATSNLDTNRVLEWLGIGSSKAISDTF